VSNLLLVVASRIDLLGGKLSLTLRSLDSNECRSFLLNCCY